MKDVASCDKPGVGARDLWSRDVRMRILCLHTPLQWWRRSNRRNWSILVRRGKEINWDFPSSGERKGNSPNWICYGNITEMWCFGYGITILEHNRNVLERTGKVGDTPVS